MSNKAYAQYTISDIYDGEDGVGILSIEEQYYKSTSNSTQTGGSWSTTQPTWENGKYIWTRSKITWDNDVNDPNHITYTTPVLSTTYQSLYTDVTNRISNIATQDNQGNWSLTNGVIENTYVYTDPNHTNAVAIGELGATITTTKDQILSTVSNTYATQTSLTTEANKRKATYVTSSTASGTRAKSGTCANFELYNGAVITCMFTNANTQSAPTLNVNSTGAIQIRSSTGAALTEEQYKWAAGSSFTLVYVEESSTNKYWRMQDSNMISRLHTDETQISQTANNVLIQATSSDSTAAAAGQHLIQSFINVAPSGVQISADKVNIAGAAIFDSYALKAEASADVEIKYAKSTSSTEFIAVSGSDGVWSDVAPAWEAGKYIWQRTGKKKVSDQEYTYTYANIQGAGVTVSEVKYAVSTTETQPADSSFTYTSVPTVAEGSWLWTRTTYSSGSKVYTKSKQGVSGTNGTNGTNSATVYLYQRASSSPEKPSSTLTYTFSTAKLSGTLGNWSQTIPSGTNPVWITIATANASATATTDTIASSEWTTPVQLVKDGTDGSPGTNGTNGTDGYNQATVYLYRRASTAPSKPSTSTTYTFSSGALSSVPSGWYRDIPASDGNPCYVTSVGVISRSSTYTIASSAWSTPVKLVEDGTDATPLTISSVTYAVTSNEIQPSSFPYSTVPSVSEGQWLWINILFSDATSVITKSKQGISGTSSQWYFGDKVTHMSGDATPATGITSAVIGDMYLNNTTYSVYRCTVAGASGTARWTYTGNLLTGLLDDLEISGTNLLRYTESPKYTGNYGTGWNVFSPANDTTTDTSEGIKITTGGTRSGFKIPLVYENAIVGGETVTISFEYRTNSSSQNSAIYLLCTSGNNKSVSCSIEKSETIWKKFSQTITFASTSGQTTNAILIPYLTNCWFEIKDKSLKIEKGNIRTAWSPAPEDALAKSQQIYCRSNSTSVPNAPTAIITNTSDTVNYNSSNVNGTWTISRLPMIDINNTNYKYCYTCEQLISVGGYFLGCTAVVSDKSHTVIDGGALINESITTNKLNTNAIQGGGYTAPVSGDHYSIRGSFFDLNTGDIITPSFSVEGSAGGDAYFKGTIHSGSGEIGGFIIDETSIHNKMESFDDEILIPHKEGDVLIVSDMEGDYLVNDYELGANDYLEGTFEVDDFSGIYIGTDGIALGKGVFKINKYGSLYATNATIEGDITATSGKFGVETGYYEVDEHGLIGYIIGENGKAATGTELGYDYLKTDKIIASDGMRVMDENDTFVSFERTSSVFGIDGQSRFFISATGLNFINGREQSLFSVAQDQVERIEKTVAVVSFSTNTDVDELTRFISDIDVVEEITPYAELKINDNNDTRYRPYTLVNCVVTTESGVNVTINSDAVDDIISKMSYTYPYEYYEVTTDSTIVEGKNYYDSSENLIDPNDYIDSETGEQKSPSAEGWLEYKVESRTGYYSCTINVIYTANIISSSIVKIRGNIEVTSQGNPIRIINNEWNTNEGGNTDTMLRATNTVTGVEVGFGVGSGGQNHGIWSEKIKNWIIYCDGNNNIQIPATNLYVSGLYGNGGEFSSHVRVTNNGINGASVYSRCNNKEVTLHVSNSGNRGIYDSYRGGWIVYSPPTGGAYIPQALNVSGSIWVTSSGEAQVGTKSGAGKLYLYSSANTRGIYGYNTSGAGAYVFYVDQGGRTYFPNPVTFSANVTAQNSSGVAVHAICGSYNVALHANTGGNRGVYDTTGGAWIIYKNTSNQVRIPLVCYVDNTFYCGNTFNTDGQLHLGNAYSDAVHLSTVWSDASYHDIITRNASEAITYFGYGSATTVLRGSSCRLSSSSGSTITSDRNVKKDITAYDSKYDAFYDALNPTSYKFINGTSGRTHCGFISQDVRDALLSSGLSTSDFGGYVFDKITSRETDSDGTSIEKSDTNYLLDHGIDEIHQLIYSEFISLNTWQIQKLKKRVSELEKELEELKKLFNKRDL